MNEAELRDYYMSIGLTMDQANEAVKKAKECFAFCKKRKKKQPDTSSWDDVKEDPFVGGGW